jgi:hypothetical protein
MWKTKEIKKENGRVIRNMICQNSKPEESKWRDYMPDGEEPCKNWVEVGDTSASVLCWECTNRTVSNF